MIRMRLVAFAVAVLLAALALHGCAHLPIGGKGRSANAKNAPAARGKSESAGAVDELAEARRHTELLPHEAYWPYRLAQLRLEADSTAGAEAALHVALERDPLYPPALALLSKLDFERGRHQEAVERLEAARARAEAERPGSSLPPEILTGLALHYDALDRLDLAASVTAGVAGKGGSALAPSLAYLALRGETPEAAAEPALAALKNDSKSAVNQNNYGITRLRAGDPDAARKAFLKAVEIDPRLPGPYYNLAILEKYYALDDEAAARWFRLYRDRAREDPDRLAEAMGRQAGPVGDGAKE